jgi:ABC-type thiamine transport system substrate-binding protein
MAQANVYTSASAQAWFTDKCRISTGNNTVTYNVNIIYPTASGNIFSNAAVIPANWQADVWVGVGNELTVVGGNVTLQELGSRSSGQSSVQQAGGSLPNWGLPPPVGV